jgi:intron-binding protein aquarius
MTIDFSLSPTIRIHLISFIISAFQSLDTGIVRKECAPLVTISIWHNMSTDKKRERKLGQSVKVGKAWRAAAKRYDAADDATKPRLRFERSWLTTLVIDFINQLYNPKSKSGMSLLLLYRLILHSANKSQKIFGIAKDLLSSYQIFRVSYRLGDM